MNMPLADPSCRARDRRLRARSPRAHASSYGGIVRLRDVTAAFPAHRVTAILGPSGCGKSTLLRALNRTLELVPGARVDAGSVLLDGQEIYRNGNAASAVRAQIGMLQQKPTPFPMSILDNVLFGARYHGFVRDRGADAARTTSSASACGTR